MLRDALMRMGRLSKLGPKQRLLCFILFMKHDNVTIYDAFLWNWAKSSLCDDAISITSCINHALVDEIYWPSSFERVALGNQLHESSGCLRFINKTLVEIQKPWKNPKHWTWFNGHTKKCNEQHCDFGPSWCVYLYWFKLPWVLSQCKHSSPFGHLSKAMSILHPSGRLFWISFRGSKVLGGRNVHHEEDGEVKVTTKCRLWCHPCLV
jgi:hypothetical protein